MLKDNKDSIETDMNTIEIMVELIIILSIRTRTVAGVESKVFVKHYGGLNKAVGGGSLQRCSLRPEVHGDRVVRLNKTMEKLRR
ncbi:hypothetical protein Q3G72_009092 [Acer saccharum]|nr:hypothetical protein Q3G72_009092 [Acer saccharum]